MRKKVLIMTYYWPPSGGAGVQRWLKFVKYLRGFNWEPIIYTPKNPEFPEHDNSLQNDIPENISILKTPVWEPYSAYKKFIGQEKKKKISAGFLSEDTKPKLSESISVWIRGNFFIPDARKFWIKPSVNFLSNYLENNHINALVSTGPPHSMHLIAMKLKKKFNIPWLADFRDPWTNIDFYKDLKLTRFANNYHHKLELSVLKNADKVVVISDGMADDFKKIFNRNYEIITNGFDPDDLNQNDELLIDKKFSVAHIGSLVKTRNPIGLWNVLHLLVESEPDFKDDLEIKLVGKVDVSVKQSIEHFRLNNFVNKIEYLQHNEVIKTQKQSQVLLLLINNTPNAKMILTGKFFEYLAAKRPIICIGPSEGDAAKILKQTNSGLISDFNDVNGLKNNVLKYYNLFKNNKLFSESTGIENFSRKELTGKLAGLLESV